jgi:hypothetical protein
MRCLADREVRQRRAFHEIAGGHIGCVGGGRCRRLLRGGRGAPPVPFARPDPFPQGPSRFFPGYRGAVRIRTIETGARAAMLSSSPRPWHRPRPLFRRPIFIRGEVVAWVLEPPAQFLRWTDHLEIVLPQSDAARRCQTAGARSAPGTRTDGCSYTVAGRCVIIRVDDPGVARHELAHCNGWKHPEP